MRPTTAKPTPQGQFQRASFDPKKRQRLMSAKGEAGQIKSPNALYTQANFSSDKFKVSRLSSHPEEIKQIENNLRSHPLNSPSCMEVDDENSEIMIISDDINDY